MPKAATLPSLMMMTSIVSEESLPSDTDRRRQTQRHTDTDTQNTVTATYMILYQKVGAGRHIISDTLMASRGRPNLPEAVAS